MRLYLKAIWLRLLTFFRAVKAAFKQLADVDQSTHAYLIQSNGTTVELTDVRTDSRYPWIDLTKSLELYMNEVKGIPEPLRKFDVDKKTLKLKHPVFLEPDETTVAALVYMKDNKKQTLNEMAKTLADERATVTEDELIEAANRR